MAKRVSELSRLMFDSGVELNGVTNDLLEVLVYVYSVPILVLGLNKNI